MTFRPTRIRRLFSTTLTVVKGGVRALGPLNKVFGPVVVPDLVFVVNLVARLKAAAVSFLPHNAMFGYIPLGVRPRIVGHVKQHITAAINAAAVPTGIVRTKFFGAVMLKKRQRMTTEMAFATNRHCGNAGLLSTTTLAQTRRNFLGRGHVGGPRRFATFAGQSYVVACNEFRGAIFMFRGWNNLAPTTATTKFVLHKGTF